MKGSVVSALIGSMFGTSGLLTKPESQVRSLIFRTPNHYSANDHIKSIVQPRYVLPRVPANPHSFSYKEGAFCVNELGTPIQGPFSRNSTTLVQLNHYYCRSRQEIDEKLKRGRADTGTCRSLEEFLSVDRIATVEDRTACELKERLDRRPSSSMLLDTVSSGPTSAGLLGTLRDRMGIGYLAERASPKSRAR